MIRAALLCCVVGLATTVPTAPIDEITPLPGEKCGYDSCTDASPDVLNVHIVAHTHDDVGWLKTVDQYYYGKPVGIADCKIRGRNNIQKAGVKYILDSVIKELWEDPKRKFIYVETAFFWKWWTVQPDSVKSKVHALVRQGRLQFVGGAWSMNDEAASHFQSTIDQFTWGLRKLNETFGECGRPTVGWQIDPFGHSRDFASTLSQMGYDGLFLGRIDYQDKKRRLGTKTMETLWRGSDDLALLVPCPSLVPFYPFGHSRDFASTLSQMGYDGLFLGRIDYQDKKRRLGTKTMETLWRGSDDLGKPTDIFTGVLYNTYSPPPGFCFDVLCSDEPIIDDRNSPMYNVDKRVTDFLSKAHKMAEAYTTNNVLVTMGDDFQYQDAAMWFTNLDKLIQHANLKAAKEGMKTKLFYSTPQCYLKAVKDANPTLPTKQDDFFPYSSDSTAFWTGYFTSRPTTKFMEREGNNFLQTFKTLQVLADLPKTNMFVLNELKSAMGVMQHHDAITGTEKQHVTHDYERIMSQAVEDAFIIGNQAFNKLTKSEVNLFFQRCEFNQSQCSVTERSETFIVTVYNNQGLSKSSVKVELPVIDDNSVFTVYDEDGKEIPSEVSELPPEYLSIPTRNSLASHSLYFLIKSMPALGFKSFYVKKDKKEYIRRKRDKRVYDYYTDINNYWKEVKDKTEVDIKNIEADPPKVDNFIDISQRDRINTVERDYDKNLNWDVMKDGKENNEEIKHVINNAVRKLAEETMRVTKKERKIVFPTLNDDEMRMLADDPMVVEQPQEIVLENEFITLNIDKRTGWMNYSSKSDGTSVSFLPEPGYYIGCEGNNEVPANRSSGAYIFRPNMTATPELKTFETFDIVKVILTGIKQEVVLKFDDSVTLIIGINKVVYISSIIHIEEGREYVLRIKTDLKTDGVFYTDSNGRQMLKRLRNKRPQWNVSLAEPIPGNYYPVVSEIYIEDNDLRVVMNVDRARGGSSLEDGSFEIMQHRRLKHDDAFGVGEALNETAGGLGLYSIDNVILQMVPNTKDNLIKSAVNSYQFFSPAQVFVADANGVTLEEFNKMTNVYSLLKSELPIGLHLLTLEPWSDGQVLIRFENYLEKSLSPDAISVDLRNIFKTIEITSIRETTLAANRWLSDYKKWEWKTENEFSKSFNEEYGNGDIERAKDVKEVVDDGLTIKLKAKQIRTFIAGYKVVNKM